MQYQFFAYANGTRSDKGLAMNAAWDGDWTTAVALNEELSSIDYLLTIPFTDLAHPGLKTRWIMNLHRYDSATKQTVTLMRSPNPSFANPQLWPFVQVPEEVVRPYVIGAGGGGYTESSVTLDLANHTGRERTVTVHLVAGDVSLERAATLSPGVNRISFPLALQEPKVTVRLTENGAPLCHQILVLDRRDPVSMLGRLSFYMNETEAPFRVATSVANPEGLTAVLSCGDISVRKQAAARFEIALPLEAIPEGVNRVTLALVDEQGKTVAQTGGEVVKRPFREGSSQVNHFSRSLLHDGKPVVPFAPFMVIYGKWGMSEKQLDGYVALLEKYGFRFVHILFQSAQNTDRENALTRHFLDATQEKGIKVLLWSKYYDYTDEACARTREALDSPNVISQMVLDEPELGMPSDVARDFLRKMRALHPYHPVHMNNTVLGIPNRYANLETDILMLDDYLTNRENRTVLSVVEQAGAMWQAGASEGKPCWYVIVCNNTSLHYREPTYGEQIAQTYGNIATGVTGFSYFYGWPGTAGNWKAYFQLNREVLALTNVLTSEEQISPSSATGDPNLLRHRTFRHDGHVYVVACNIDEGGAGEVTFTLPAGLRYAGQAEVMFEDRMANVSRGTFNGSFTGYARHVYRVKVQ